MVKVKIFPVHNVKVCREHHFKVKGQLHVAVAVSLGKNSCTHLMGIWMGPDSPWALIIKGSIRFNIT